LIDNGNRNQRLRGWNTEFVLHQSLDGPHAAKVDTTLSDLKKASS